ncbi:hypothetical protein HDU96_002669 [Phlyctochytrium bullatum]|nr:hypothetical protein HDU96_002669 [Phlyctochytrium bullatum]
MQTLLGTDGTEAEAPSTARTPSPSAEVSELTSETSFEKLPVELVQKIVFNLNPNQMPVLSLASRNFRKYFHLPCNKDGVAFASAHIHFWGVMHNAPCDANSTPFDAIDFASLTRTYAVAAISTLGLTTEVLYRIAPDYAWKETVRNGALNYFISAVLVRPEPQPVPLVGLLCKLVRMNVMDLTPHKHRAILAEVCAKFDSVELVEAMLTSSADSLTELLVESISDRAFSRDAISILSQLFGREEWTEYARQNAQRYLSPQGRSLLHTAAKEGRENYVKLLLDVGVDVDQKVAVMGLYTSDDPCTALHFACQAGHLGVVRLLLDSGASTEIASGSGMTALHFAVSRSHEDIVALLLARGANPSVDGGEYRTSPLHRACEKNSPSLLKMLLDAGANVNAREFNGNTPLHRAVIMEMSVELAELLIAHGADVNATNNDNDTPLHLATAPPHPSSRKCPPCKLLLDHGANPNILGRWAKTPLYNLCYAADETPEMMELFRRPVWDPNLADWDGITPLQRLAISSKDFAEPVRCLIALGADVHSMDTLAERTALHWAASRSKPNTVKVLLEAGADPLALDGEGFLPSELDDVGRVKVILEEAMRAASGTSQL